MNQRGFIPILVLLAVILLAGFVIYQKQTTSPTPQSTEQPNIVDKTANWKTYTNTEYGYSLKYPSDWSYQVSPKGPGQVLIHPTSDESKGDLATIVITVTESIKQPLISGNGRNILSKKTTIQIAGIEGEQGEFEEYGTETKYIQSAVSNNGKAYYLNLHNLLYRSIYDQILSTFKFLDQKDETIRSQSSSLDSSKKVMMKTTGKDENLVRSLIVSNIDGSNEVELLSKKADVDTWKDLTSANWSSDSKYLYLLVSLPDGGDLYVFKSNGEKFKNSKKYLQLSELGYNQMPIVKAGWSSPTKLEIEGGVPMVIQPKSYKKYTLDLDKEKLQEDN